jgi:cytoskeletal protein RodZ
MHEEIKELGAMFKERRKEMHLSLKEVENATSIRSSYLEAIEEGRVQDFISGVYAQGFMKQYAVFLGMDADKVVQEHAAAFKMPAEKHEFSYGIGTLEVRGTSGGGVKWLPNLLWASVAAVVLVLAYYAAKFFGVI